MANILRFIFVGLIQVLVLKGIDLNTDQFHYFNFICYPILIMLLPIDLSRVTTILIAFALGIFVDVFYDSMGMHAGACVFLAYIRPYVLKLLEPRGGYTHMVPGLGNMEFSWMLIYISICLMAFLVFYFSLDAFSFVYFIRIVLNVFFSFIVSIVLILIYQIIFRTKY